MGTREKFEFTGHGGDRLAALLERPDGEPVATTLFAHCFTCGKDVVAASRISRALVARGHAVMRFDFTGLGNSDGDFANTNFSSNVADLVAAAAALRERDLAPALLVGHSLGGTAVLAAAPEIPECRAVVTIGSPADARHVAAQFGTDVERIRTDGEADVTLAGRPFTIRRQFLDDIERTSTEHLPRLRAALLVMHAPLDETVSIDEAGRIFSAARHPKSFVSLDGADHLISRAADATRAAEMIAAWASRYVAMGESTEARKPAPDSAPAPAAETTSPAAAAGSAGSASAGAGGTGGGDASREKAHGARSALAPGEVRVGERDGRFLQDVESDTHRWFADEPKRVGGSDIGPDPYEHLLAAVGTCTAMTLRMYAARKGMALERASVTLRHAREHLTDCEGCEEEPRRIDVIERDIELVGELDDGERRRLMAIADRCPVHRTLEGDLEIRTRAL